MPEKSDDKPDTLQQLIAERYPDLEPVPSVLPKKRSYSPNANGAGPPNRSVYTEWITPIEKFYILNHYPTPEIDADSWTVSLTGAITEETDLQVDKIIKDYPTITVAHTMECAGNGRTGFPEPSDNNEEFLRRTQWHLNGVGNALWTGTPLQPILEKHGADMSNDMWLTAVGGDAPEGEDVFARSIPMSKVVDDCILAYKMNGQQLPPVHGYPLRLIVPGWYGVNSVKWIEELRVMDTMIHGDKWERYTRWQQDGYRIYPHDVDTPKKHESIDVFDTWDQMESDEIDAPYTYDQNVMSMISQPDDGKVISATTDATIDILGVAWGGDDGVELVEVSTDGGETWDQAEFFGPKFDSTSWRLFRYKWDADLGSKVLVSRATDGRGRVQPATTSSPHKGRMKIRDDAFPWNERAYGNNAYLTFAITVTVEPEK
jgi:DMSO/TMAO reductase YedYZ molybdopterin-dependent catalytic subunit